MQTVSQVPSGHTHASDSLCKVAKNDENDAQRRRQQDAVQRSRPTLIVPRKQLGQEPLLPRSDNESTGSVQRPVERPQTAHAHDEREDDPSCRSCYRSTEIEADGGGGGGGCEGKHEEVGDVGGDEEDEHCGEGGVDDDSGRGAEESVGGAKYRG